MKRIGRWFVLNGEKFYFVKVGGEFNVFYNGKVYRLGKDRKIKEVEEERRDEIKSPITGKVVSIKVQEGQRVKKGDALAVISAMKMEIILSSPDDAIVERVFKKEGELVNKDEIVIKLSFLEKG
ncbi:MAG: acetyl-CoA carboxylase biotin carboxyl carrier protein subunit [Candidatus Caldipriscus sp.]|nr:acetyl-CoA carboxylase biotin carboxyl carrier protein subunit [Candidatus Caldipriscus sp.]